MESINIILNGNQQTLDAINTLSQLVEFLELKGRYAIEINQEVIPKSTYPTYQLRAGDKVEIVQAIGGG